MKKYWKLPKQDLELWLEALRSGEYKQCSGILHKPEEGYCCLGVFARVKLGDNFDEKDYGEAGLDNISEFDDFEVLNGYQEDGLFNILTSFNDGDFIFSHSLDEVMLLPEIVNHNNVDVENLQKQSFEFIADFIEKYVEAV